MSKLLDIAKSQIGVKESNGGDDKFIKWFGGLPLSSSWCAMYVSWCADQAGILGKFIPKFASCDDGAKWFRDKGRYQKSKAYGGTYVPKQDDVIFFSSKYTQVDATHTGLVDFVGNAVVNTVEGNSSDAVRTRTYELSDKYIIGYGVVGESVSAPKPVKAKTKAVQHLLDITKALKPMLQEGSKGPVVAAVQAVLIEKGFSCGPSDTDGKYGPDTKAAVKKFQKEVVKMKVPTGSLAKGDKTWLALVK